MQSYGTSKKERLQLPEVVGVYLFYNKDEELLYVGKSLNLKKRIYSHFSTSGLNKRNVDIRNRIAVIKIIPTASELGALLLELYLIKELSPIYNRVGRRVRRLFTLEVDFTAETCVKIKQIWVGHPQGFQDKFGVFRSRHRAVDWLNNIAKEYRLCPARLGLVGSSPGACFWQQLDQCLGVCAGQEDKEKHDRRFQEALRTKLTKRWPFPGKINISNKNSLATEEFEVDQWCLIKGEIGSSSQSMILDGFNQMMFDYDIYKVLVNNLDEVALTTN